jgi:tellurite resistance protein
LLEAAFLVASADGTVSKEEVGSLIDLVSEVGGEGVTPGELAGMVYEFSTTMEKEGRQSRFDALAAAVVDPSARREILGFASLVALCDHELAPSELFVLHSLGKAFGFDAQAVSEIITSVRDAMGDGAA